MLEFLIGGGLGVLLGYLVWRSGPAAPPKPDNDKLFRAVEQAANKRIDEAERHTIDIAVPLLKKQRDDIIEAINKALK